MSSLLKEFARGDVQADLKNSDGSDAGKSDTTTTKTDVSFSLMRNMINTAGGNITGSDVNDYLERAHDLNDEVESVGFAIEDEDGKIIKVYVNLQDADKFEEDMAKTLGLDDDIEAAINLMAQKYDIVDVVWPEEPADDSANVADDVSVDSSVADFEMDDDTPSVGDALPADSDESDPKTNLIRDIDNALAADNAGDEPTDGETPPEDEDSAPVDGETPPEDLEDGEPEATGSEETEDDQAVNPMLGGDSSDDTTASTTDEVPPVDGEEESTEDEMEPVLNDDGSQKLDKDGNPVMRKKRVKKEDEAEVSEALKEGAKEEVEAHVQAHLSNGNKGKYFIQALKTGGSDGRKSYKVSKSGDVVYFETKDLAEQEAGRLRKVKNAPGAKASYKYEVKLAEASLLGQVMSAAAKAADVEQSDREYIAQRQLRDKFIPGVSVRAKGSKNVGKIVAPAGRDKVMVSFGLTPSTRSEHPFNIADLELAEAQGADVMSIGSNFLQRLAEANDNDGIKDGLNIPLDSQQRMLVSRLKRPIEKKIVGLFAMTGIFGRLLNTPEAEDGIIAAADFLRKNRSAKMAFDAFYTGLGKAKGLAPTVQEAKLKRGSFLQKKFETVLTALGLPADLVATDGPGVIAPVLFKTTKVIDSDGALRTALNKLALRLGVSSSDAMEPLKEAINGVKAIDFSPAQWHEFFKDVEDTTDAEFADQEYLVDRILTVIENEDAEISVDKAKELAKKISSLALNEEVNVGNDDFFEGVIALALALGIPEKNLQFQRPTLMSSLRAKKLALMNRGMIQQRMAALTQMLSKATRTTPAVKADEPGKVAESLLAEGLLLEAFGDLEAITDNELKKYNILEPNGGPAMEASYEGGGVHEDTKMIIGVDPDRDDQKNLTVEIASPWDGIIHRKNFTNDKAGYKAAMDYANILRTTNLKTGGRPRGWKEEKTVVAVAAE
jgi:hypothetical protein